MTKHLLQRKLQFHANGDFVSEAELVAKLRPEQKIVRESVGKLKLRKLIKSSVK